MKEIEYVYTCKWVGKGEEGGGDENKGGGEWSRWAHNRSCIQSTVWWGNSIVVPFCCGSWHAMNSTEPLFVFLCRQKNPYLYPFVFDPTMRALFKDPPAKWQAFCCRWHYKLCVSLADEGPIVNEIQGFESEFAIGRQQNKDTKNGGRLYHGYYPCFCAHFCKLLCYQKLLYLLSISRSSNFSQDVAGRYAFFVC